MSYEGVHGAPRGRSSAWASIAAGRSSSSSRTPGPSRCCGRRAPTVDPASSPSRTRGSSTWGIAHRKTRSARPGQPQIEPALPAGAAPAHRPTLPTPTLIGRRRAPTAHAGHRRRRLRRVRPGPRTASTSTRAWKGCCVEVGAFVVVSPRNDFGEISGSPTGRGATGRNARGGLTIAPGDFNPERIQTRRHAAPRRRAGASTSGTDSDDVVGVMSSNFGNFEVLVTRRARRSVPGGLARGDADLRGRTQPADRGTLNLVNLDPATGREFAALAGSSCGCGRPTSCAVQRSRSTRPHERRGRPRQRHLRGRGSRRSCGRRPADELRDIAAGRRPGRRRAGRHIRVGFLFDPAAGRPSSTAAFPTLDRGDRGRRGRHRDAASRGARGASTPGTWPSSTAGSRWSGSSSSPAGTACSSSSTTSPRSRGARRSSAPCSRRPRRREQRQPGRHRHASRAPGGPGVPVLVPGDLNDFYFSAPLVLRGGPARSLSNLHDPLTPVERYTFVFEGNAQTLDHILVSDSLARRGGVRRRPHHRRVRRAADRPGWPARSSAHRPSGCRDAGPGRRPSEGTASSARGPR